jgi:hypothetical protein
MDGPLPQRHRMHPETLRGLSQAQQFHAHEIKQDQYGSLSDTLRLRQAVGNEREREMFEMTPSGIGKVA